MARKKWTTDPQEEWLAARLPEFCTAQQDKATQKFFPDVYEAWFAKFPSRIPTEEEVANAEGDAKVAAAAINKADRDVCISRYLRLVNSINNHNF